MLRTERLQFYASTLGLLAISLLAFTKKQRDSIAFERDEGRCQAPFPHRCNKDKGLEVHHIKPQRYCDVLGIEEYVDKPENAVAICKEAHNQIHPDRARVMKIYRKAKSQGRDPFQEMFEERDEKLKKRMIYWNDRYDRPLEMTAFKRTQEAKKKGWEFPERKRRTN